MNDPANDNEPEEQPDVEFVAELVDAPTADEPSSGPPQQRQPTKPMVAYDPTVLVPAKPKGISPPPSPYSNLAAKGGAVGAIVLGTLSLVGSFITSYAILNSFLGILLGVWGLGSNHKRMATIGIILCLVSAFFCVAEISNWIQTIWLTEEP